MALGERIAEQHRRAYHGEAWHGPAVLEVLEGVMAAKALAKPIARAHSIWELVLHLTSWERIVLARMEGKPPVNVTGAVDWPSPPAKVSKAAWDEARAALETACDATTKSIGRMSEAKLLSPRPGTNSTYEELAHGQTQHALYHAGQMAVLKKGSRPRAR